MVILYFLSFMESSGNCLETACFINSFNFTKLYEVHSVIISTLQMSKLRLRDTSSQFPAKSILPIFCEIGLELGTKLPS